MGMQEKVLAEFEKIAKAAKLDCDVEKNWANQGQVSLRKGFKTIANLSFSFQGGYMTIALIRGSEQASYCGAHDQIYFIYNGEEKKILSMLADVKRACK